MAASIVTAPPDKSLSQDPIWVTVGTDVAIAPKASVELTISSSGPADGDTLEITWSGITLEFTAAAADGDSALDLPLKGADTLAVYADKVAARLRENEILTDAFAIERSSSGGEKVTLVQRTLAVVNITVTNGLTNVAESVVDVTELTAAGDNLVALLSVYSDTGNPATDELLLRQHAPYDLATGEVDIDISSAFAGLEPHLPTAATINPVSPTFSSGLASSAYLSYYLRYADKSGTPAVAGAMVKTVNAYLALLGSRGGDAYTSAIGQLCHNYRRRDKAAFVKPVSEDQPDWVYWLTPDDESSYNVYINIILRWSDGTTSSYNPFGTTTSAFEDRKVYWFPSGYRQMKLHLQTPSGGTADDAYVIGYDWRLVSAAGETIYVTVKYEVDWYHHWNHYLLFSNGLGGCESVTLRGKGSEGYEPTAEVYQRPRKKGHTAQVGDFGVYAAEGRPTWELNTGHYDDPFYLDHLRQLPLSEAWLIDVENRRFLKVIVEARKLEEIRSDDETLFSLNFSLRAGWIDQAANV